MGSNIDDNIAGTNLKASGVQLPAPKIVKTQGMESGVIETPLSDGSPIPTPVKKPRIKREVTIREADNGYILSVWAGDFREEWVFGSLKKSMKAIIAFLSTTEDEK